MNNNKFSHKNFINVDDIDFDNTHSESEDTDDIKDIKDTEKDTEKDTDDIKDNTINKKDTFIWEAIHPKWEKKVLSKNFPLVFTFEPSYIHFQYVKSRFKNDQKVTTLNSASETGLEQVLNNLNGELNMYLDGHYSGDNTFEGSKVTPIREELKIIEKYLNKFSKLFVAIDDFRVFGSQDGHYPTKFSLVEFCEINSLEWKVEHDIFMFKKN